MQWVKKLWFPVAAIVLVVIIGFNVYRIVDYRLASNDAPASNAAAQGSGTRGDPARTETPVPDLVSSPGPRQLTLRLQLNSGDSQPDEEKLTAALEAIGPVEEATVKGDSVKLTIANSLDLSELVQRLGFQDATLVEDQFAIEGGVRLKVAGMT
ncbi:MAG: hypothetical protein IH991_04505 [Planctomycetes bacterium]|nr:hypothetical protein [Planctomycetota bacterium]